jgi:hypothetical protein
MGAENLWRTDRIPVVQMAVGAKQGVGSEVLRIHRRWHDACRALRCCGIAQVGIDDQAKAIFLEKIAALGEPGEFHDKKIQRI